MGSFSDTVGAVTLSAGSITGTSSSALTGTSYTDTSTGTTSITANLAGSGALTKSGSGTLTLSGANSYDGGTNINLGVLTLGSSSAIGSGGTISFGGGVLKAFDTVDYSNRFSTADNQQYSIDTNSQNITWATSLVSLGGSLTKTGLGTLTLSGANTYNGVTTISAGTLVATHATALGSTTGGTTVASTATLDIQAAIGLEAITLNGGTISTTATGGSLGGTINLAANSIVSASSALNLTLSGVIATVTASSLTKAGAGTVTLAGINTYTGVTTISAGTLAIGGAGSLGSGSYAGTIANDGIFLYSSSANQTLSGIKSGSGALTKDTSTTSTLTLAASNAYLGTTTINAGTLTISASERIANTSALLINGGIFNLGTFSESVGAVTLSGGSITGTGSSTLTGSSYTDTSSGSTSITAILGGSGALTKSGSGTLTLSGSNIYSGATNITGGILEITNASGLGSTVGATTISPNATLKINGNLSITEALNISGNGNASLGAINTVAASASGTVTLGGAITLLADSTIVASIGHLIISGGINGGFTLTITGNGNLSYTESIGRTTPLAGLSSISTGTTNIAAAINSTGLIQIETLSGNLSVSQNITTTSTSTSAITLNAGKTASAGTAAGGNLIFSGSPLLSTGSDGRVNLFSGSISGSTGLTALVGSGSGHFRYNSDELSTNFTTSLGTGIYAIYREQPTISIAADPLLLAYSISPSPTTTKVGMQNGDTLSQAISSTITTAVGGSLSSSGYYVIGDHSLTPSGAVGGLGYAFSYSTSTLTVSAKTFTITGSIDINKPYDATTDMPLGVAGYVVTSGAIGGDNVSLTGAAAYASSNALSQAIQQGTLSLTGSDSTAYLLVWAGNGSGTISKATLTITANNDSKFVTQTDATGYGGVSYAGFKGGQNSSALSVAPTVSRSNFGVAGAENQGVYTDVLVPTGAAATNYNFSYVNGTYTIIPASQLSIKIANTYGTYGSAPSYIVSEAKYLKINSDSSTSIIDLTSTAVVSGNSVRVTDSTGATASFNVSIVNALFSNSGTLKAQSYQLAGTDLINTSGNFTSLALTGSYQVNAKGLSIATSGISKEYNGSTSMDGLTLALIGKVSTLDNVTASGVGNFSSSSVGSAKNYSITSIALAGLDAANYYLTGGSATSGTTGVVTAKPLTVSGIVAANKVYDSGLTATISTAAAVYTGLVSGDDFSVAATGLFVDKNVADGKTVTLSSTYSGASIGNYSITSQASTTANIRQLPSVTWVGASGGTWSTASNWAGAVLPDGNNVAQVVINAGSSVIYDSAIIGTIGSSIVNNGVLSFTGTNNFNLSNSVSGSGSINQIGTGILVISGNNTFTGNVNINSSTVYLGNNQALGEGKIISNGGSLGLLDGVRLTSLTVNGPVTNTNGLITLLSDIRTVGDQTYNANIVLLPTNTTISDISLGGMASASATLAVSESRVGASMASYTQATVSLLSQNGNIALLGTVDGAQDAQLNIARNTPLQGQSFIANAGTGLITIGDSVGVTAKIYDFLITAGRINILADVLTLHAQSYTGASYIGDSTYIPGRALVAGALQTSTYQNLFNYSSGGVTSTVITSAANNFYIRTLVSKDPLITFSGSIDDTVAGVHTLLLGAVADSISAVTDAPTINLLGTSIGQNSRPYSYNFQTLILNSDGDKVGTGTISAPINSTTVADATMFSSLGLTTTAGNGLSSTPATPSPSVPLSTASSVAFLPATSLTIAPTPIEPVTIPLDPSTTVSTSIVEIPVQPTITQSQIQNSVGSGALMSAIFQNVNFFISNIPALRSSVQIEMTPNAVISTPSGATSIGLNNNFVKSISESADIFDLNSTTKSGISSLFTLESITSNQPESEIKTTANKKEGTSKKKAAKSKESNKTNSNTESK